MVRAKFKVVEIKDGQVAFEVVTCGSKENEDFFSFTPFGEIRIGIVNENALKEFEDGKEYYVDFTKAPTPTREPGF